MELQEKQLIDVRKLVGMNLRKYRMAAGFSQVELCKRIRITRSGLSCIELGNYNPNLNDLAEIAYELNIPLSYLFEGAQFEKADTLYTKLEKDYKLLKKKHESLLREVFQIVQRNS